MHLISERHRQPRKNRTGVERAFRYVYTALSAAQIGCFLVFIMQQSNASTKTFTGGIWFPPSTEFDFILGSKLSNCSYSAAISHAGYNNIHISMTDMKETLLVRFAGRVRIVAVVMGSALVLGAANRLLFDFNVFWLRSGYLIFRKDVLMLADVALVVLLFFYNLLADSTAAPLRTMIQQCGVIGENALPFVFPNFAVHLFVYVTLFTYGLGACIFLRNTLTRDVARRLAKRSKKAKKRHGVTAATVAELDSDDSDPSDREERRKRRAKREKRRRIEDTPSAAPEAATAPPPEAAAAASVATVPAVAKSAAGGVPTAAPLDDGGATAMKPDFVVALPPVETTATSAAT